MTYSTCAGDMWDLISYKVYGSCKYTDALINANRNYIDYFIFPAGIELNVPDITPETKKAALPPWRR